MYSLVTKLEYFKKPTDLDYDIAFNELTKDFKRRGFKKLVCSAMGCVRDRISPKHFIKNLTHFQEITGADIEIISYNQKSRRLLWNGMSHHSFVKLLRQIIACRHLQDTSVFGAEALTQLEGNGETSDLTSSKCQFPTTDSDSNFGMSQGITLTSLPSIDLSPSLSQTTQDLSASVSVVQKQSNQQQTDCQTHTTSESECYVMPRTPISGKKDVRHHQQGTHECNVNSLSGNFRNNNENMPASALNSTVAMLPSGT